MVSKALATFFRTMKFAAIQTVGEGPAGPAGAARGKSILSYRKEEENAAVWRFAARIHELRR